MALKRAWTRVAIAVASGGLAGLGAGGYLIAAAHDHTAASAPHHVSAASTPLMTPATTPAAQQGPDVNDGPDTSVAAETPGTETDGQSGYQDANANADTQQTGEH